MKYVTIAARVLMGLIFIGSSIAFFVTTPPPMEGPVADFFNGLNASGYFLNFLKGTELVCGLLLVSGFFVPLALVVLAPIVLNIFLVHLFLVPEGLVMAIVLGVFETYLAFFSKEYSPVIKQLFRMR